MLFWQRILEQMTWLRDSNYHERKTLNECHISYNIADPVTTAICVNVNVFSLE